MAEATMNPDNAPGGSETPRKLNPIARFWRRISPRLVPIFAVITALIVTIPLLIFTQRGGSVIDGLEVTRMTYAALLEGSLGLAVGEVVEPDDVRVLRQLAEESTVNVDRAALTQRDLLGLSRLSDLMVQVGRGNVLRFEDLLQDYDGQTVVTTDPLTGESTEIVLDDATIDTLGDSVSVIDQAGDDKLRELVPLLRELVEQPQRDVRNLAATFVLAEVLEDEGRSDIEALAPIAAEYGDDDLLLTMRLIRDLRVATQQGSIEGVDHLLQAYNDLLLLDALELDPYNETARLFEDLNNAGTDRIPGVERVRELMAFERQLQAAEIEDVEELARNLRFTNALYSANALSEQDVIVAFNTQLPVILDNSLVVKRPGNRVLFYQRTRVDSAGATVVDTPDVGVIKRERLLSEGGSVIEPETVYLRISDYVLLFLPANLEQTILRSIPYIIAGLAVALGFKAGLFNIGAEGQINIGAIVAAWIGFTDPTVIAPVFAVFVGIVVGLILVALALRRKGLSLTQRYAWIIGGALVGTAIATGGQALATSLFDPSDSYNPILHLLLAGLGGIVGGGLWGFIPGILKAFTGAHEVINTIMLNFIGIRLVDWLIKSSNPVILRDMAASSPRTPFLRDSARLPTFDTFDPAFLIFCGILMAILMLALSWSRIKAGYINALLPIIWTAVVTVLGLFIIWVSVNGNLHVGLIVMVAAVWFVDQFLERTTPGFELRTVGANPNAARYAGMSVRWNVILALTMAGALAGMAGMVEVTGVEHTIQPPFLAGLGFDSIAVALLARNNPRNMITAGLLWGALLTGSALIQVNAGVSIDLVKIIQAEIIMFIAADAIIRYLWLVPEATVEEKAAAQFSKGWGG